jgi:hypothetical protein
MSTERKGKEEVVLYYFCVGPRGEVARLHWVERRGHLLSIGCRRRPFISSAAQSTEEERERRRREKQRGRDRESETEGEEKVRGRTVPDGALCSYPKR